MRFKEFLNEALHEGEERVIWTGSTADYSDAIFACYHYKRDEDDFWLNATLENGTKLKFLRFTTIQETDGLREYYDEYKMSWMKNGQVAVANVISCPGWFDDIQNIEFFFDRSAFEKNTIKPSQWRNIQRQWINSLKEAKKVPKEDLIKPNSEWVVYDSNHVTDELVAAKVPKIPKHGDLYDFNNEVNIPEGDKIIFKHWHTTPDRVGEPFKWAVIEWRGQTLYTVGWMFPGHIENPKEYRKIKLKWLKSLKNLKEEEELNKGDVRYAYCADRNAGTALCYYETENSRDEPVIVDAYICDTDKLTIHHTGMEWETPTVWFEIEGEPYIYFMPRDLFLANTVDPNRWKEIQHDWLNSVKGK
jgi:hypothetical protein